MRIYDDGFPGPKPQPVRHLVAKACGCELFIVVCLPAIVVVRLAFPGTTIVDFYFDGQGFYHSPVTDAKANATKRSRERKTFSQAQGW